jgi:hypothetical protein
LFESVGGVPAPSPHEYVTLYTFAYCAVHVVSDDIVNVEPASTFVAPQSQPENPLPDGAVQEFVAVVTVSPGKRSFEFVDMTELNTVERNPG